MKKIVVDTNVLISSILTSEGKPNKVMSLVSNKNVQLFYSKEILSEYKRVLDYDKLNIAPYLREETIKKIVSLGTLINPAISSIPFVHEDDRVFYDTARESGAILVTGNIKHYPDDSAVMSPTSFLEKFDS